MLVFLLALFATMRIIFCIKYSTLITLSEIPFSEIMKVEAGVNELTKALHPNFINAKIVNKGDRKSSHCLTLRLPGHPLN